MATQSVEFSAPPNQTLTVRLFAAGSDTIVATAGTVTAATNRAGLYTADFTDVSAGRYRLIATNAAGTPLATWWTDLTLTTATFQAYEMPLSPTAATIADAVWDEDLRDHLTAHSTGKSLDQIRKKTILLTATVLPSPAPTTTVFNVSGLSAYPSGAFLHAVLAFDEGASVAYENSPMITYVNNGDGTGTITLEHALTAAPTAGDVVQIDPFSHVHSVAAIQAGLATLANQTTIIGYLDTEIASIKSVTDKLNTGLVADGQLFQFTANMLELAPAGGGGGGGNGDATAANQQLILDQLDVIQAKTDLIGTSQALLAGAVLEPGTVTSFPETLTIGDSYTVANGRAIQIPIIDSNGNPISEAGTLLFADADVSFIIKRSFDTVASRILTCNASFVDPPGTGTGEGPYALIEIPADQTAKGLLKYQYSGVLKFTWPGTADEVVSFETGTITFDN